MSQDQQLREHVLYLLRGGGAHLDFEKAFAGLAAELRGAKPDGIPHTPWRLLEHMRICQWDILENSISADQVSPDFPGGYWPDGDAPPSATAWDESVDMFRSDLKEMEDFVANPSTDLFAKIRHCDGQTIVREALLIADRNSYHMGQLIVFRRLRGAWDG